MNEKEERLTSKEVFLILEAWKHLVRVEKSGEMYDGLIVALSQASGTLKISTVVAGEGKKTVTLELAGADFERFSYSEGEWEDVLYVFPPNSHNNFVLRKYRASK